MTTPATENKPRTPRYKLEAVWLLVVAVLVLAVVYVQFQGGFTPKTKLTMLSSRAGLVMDPGSKVTYNGVQIGRVAKVSEVDYDGKPAAKFGLEVNPKYLKLIPANVDANIQATTVFGNKYVSFTSPKDPTPRRITSNDVIDARSVTTEINTVFQTLTEITEKVDPVKVNMTLSAVAEALTGLGDKFGQSIVNGNKILDEINPQMAQLRYDIQRLADLGDTYTAASPDLWEFLKNAVTTARTLNAQQGDVDAALLAAVGFGNTGADVLERGAPYLVRGAADLVSTSQLLDKYSPELFCTIRNVYTVEPKIAAAEGGINGYAVAGYARLIGAPNPYVYPDNLPRVNARGGPGGAPGCWQPITRDLYPAPALVVDAGASLAPYNHFGIGQPLLIDYVWGRQFGENTINP
jgi:phospholipid/cholesterol/gamma-HCH transport system substrate-binding protein